MTTPPGYAPYYGDVQTPLRTIATHKQTTTNAKRVTEAQHNWSENHTPLIYDASLDTRSMVA